MRVFLTDADMEVIKEEGLTITKEKAQATIEDIFWEDDPMPELALMIKERLERTDETTKD